MTAIRRATVFAVALCATLARAEDAPLPKGAVARFVAPSSEEGTDGVAKAPPAIEHVAISRDGRALVASVAEGPLVAWEVGSPAPRVLPDRHRAWVTGIVFSPADADVFATCSHGGDVRLWSFATGKTLPLALGRVHGDPPGPAFSPDGRRLVTAGDSRLVFWDIPAKERLVFPPPEPTVTGPLCFAWSPDGAQVAMGSAAGTLVLRQVAGGAAHVLPDTFAGAVRAVGYAPDGAALVVLAGTELRAFSAPERSVPPRSARREGRFTCAAHSPTSRLVAAGDADGRVLLLDAESLADLTVTQGHAAAVASLAFSSDGRRVVTGGTDGIVLVWDVEKLLGREPDRVERAPISGAVPSPPGPRAFPPRELRRAKVEGLADGERVEPYAGVVPGTNVGEQDVLAVLVVDGTTGLPLPGATVAQFEEVLAGPPGPAFVTSATDSNGLAFGIFDPGRSFGHWLITHEGFSPCHVFDWTRLPQTVVLQPRSDAVGRILDPYGKPVAGAEVELFLGCGHSPAIARATTAADGMFRLRACAKRGGNLVVHAPGCSAEYLDSNAFGRLGDEPVTFVTRPGADVRGRVVDIDGWGLAGAAVKADAERTVTRTLPDGTFLLRGVPTGEALTIAGPGDVGEFMSAGRSGVDWARPDLALTITLRPEDFAPEFAAGSPVNFDVLLVDRATGAHVASEDAVLVAPSTGLRYFPSVVGEDDPAAGALRFEAPEGPYLLIPGTPFASHAAAPLEVRLVSGQQVPLIVRVDPQPRLVLRYDGEKPQGVETEIVAAGAVREFPEEGSSGEVRVPASGPAAVVLREEELQRAFPVGPESNGVREAIIAWPRAKRIVVSGIVGEGFSFVSATVEASILGHDTDAGTCVLSTHASGAARFLLDDFGDGLAVVDVVLPDEPGAQVDASARRVAPTTFALRRADERPLVTKDVVHLRYSRWTDGDGTCDEEGEETPDWAGNLRMTDACVDSVVEMHPGGWVPRRVVVRSEGEQLVAWGDATLVVEVAAEDGKPLDAVLLVDGVLVDAKNGTVTLRGMDAGHHTLLVGANDRQAQTIDVELARGAERTIRVALPEIGQ